MADVKPDEQIVVDTELGEFDVYLWKAETLRGNSHSTHVTGQGPALNAGS